MTSIFLSLLEVSCVVEFDWQLVLSLFFPSGIAPKAFGTEESPSSSDISASGCSFFSLFFSPPEEESGLSFPLERKPRSCPAA